MAVCVVLVDALVALVVLLAKFLLLMSTLNFFLIFSPEDSATVFWHQILTSRGSK